jgi:hypothetical protein
MGRIYLLPAAAVCLLAGCSQAAAGHSYPKTPGSPAEEVVGGDSTVTPPAATSETVAAGGTPAAKTWSAFGDTDGIIDSYLSTIISAVGSTSSSGSGLGAYTYSGQADGDSYAHYLTAKDSAGSIVATAVHQVDIAAPAGATLDSLVDWSGTSEAFASGEGDYTIGGLSARLDYRGGVGPATFAMVSGEITTTIAEGNSAYLRIDLGADMSQTPYVAVLSCQNIGADTGANMMFQAADDNTIVNNSNHFQILVGSPADTQLKERECTASTPSFTTLQTTTVTDITTTPTRMMMHVFGNHVQASYDQGTYGLPALDGAPLSNVSANAWRGPSGSGSPGDRRFLGINFNAGATCRIAAYKLETS